MYQVYTAVLHTWKPCNHVTAAGPRYYSTRYVYASSLETEAFALRDGPLEEPRQLLFSRVLRQH